MGSLATLLTLNIKFYIQKLKKNCQETLKKNKIGSLFSVLSVNNYTRKNPSLIFNPSYVIQIKPFLGLVIFTLLSFKCNLIPFEESVELTMFFLLKIQKTTLCSKTLIQIIKRSMKSTVGKIVKEASKEKHVSPTSNTTPTTPTSPLPSVSPISSTSNVSFNLNNKNTPNTTPNTPTTTTSNNYTSSNTPNLKQFTTLPTLSNLNEHQFITRTEQFAKNPGIINQRDYRGMRLADPDNTFYDNTIKNEKAPYHIRAHANIQNDEGILIGLCTSAKKKKTGFDPQFMSDENYENQPKTQMIALYSETYRYVEQKDLVEDEKATKYLQKEEIKEKIDIFAAEQKAKKLPMMTVHQEMMILHQKIDKK